MRNKVRKSLAFLLALALVVSVMSGLGLSVSAEQESNTPGTEEVQQQDKTEAGAAPSEVKAEEEAAKPEEKPVLEEKEDEQKKQEETKTDDAAKDDANAQDGNQKDEPQAEPAAEDTVDVSKLLGKQLYDYMNTLDDKAYDAAWKELSETQKASYESYVKEVMFGKNPKIITETVTHGAAVSVTNAAGLMTFDYSSGRMRAAPMRAMANTSLSDKKVPASDGLIMSKSITKDVKNTTDTRYTIQLESYAAGKVTTSTKSTPCDIVLVLDESGSMADDFETTYEYKKLKPDTRNWDIWNDYEDVLYVKPTDGSEPIKVKLNIQEGIIRNTYTYTYTYKGVTYKKSFKGGNIPSINNEPDFFADGIEKQLYYGKRVSGVSKRSALQTAATHFLNSVAADAAKSNVDHRIAVVGFAYNFSPKVDLTNVKNTSGQIAVKNAISGLNANGATNTGAGMGQAVKIFENQSAYQDAYNSGKRKKVVVLFTDGVPTTENYFHEGVANTAIGHAKTLKGDKTTVYTIGVFEGANATQQPNASGSETEKANTFMQYVSSNFPNAKKMKDGGTGNISGGYYLTAKNTTDLNKIFESISESIGESTIQLDGTTQTIDKMSADFKLPSGTSSADIKVYKVPYTGKDSTGNDTFETNESKWTPITSGISVDTANDTVTVTGFDYTEDYVVVKDNKPRGYKLVVRIPAEYKNDAWFGGNDIASNDIGSGIYNGGSCYGTFEVPKVNRAIDYKIEAKDQTIYVTNQADLKELLAYPEKDADRTYQPNGTNNKYVDITYTLKKGNTVIGTYKINHTESAGTWTLENGQALDPALEDCTEYTWTCTVKPISDGIGALGIDGTPNNPAKETPCAPANGTVHVLYPTVNARDEFIYWGETKKPDTLITVADNWTDLNGNHTTGTPMETKPQIEVNAKLETGEEGNTPSKDSDYNVVVKLNGADKTELLKKKDRIKTAKEEHKNCDDITAVTSDKTSYDFRIHVKVKKLTVEKIVGGNMGDTNQGFTFTGRTIYDDSKNEVKNKFTLKNGQDVTFKLKVGDDVSITEDSVAGYETSYKVGNNSMNGYEYSYGEVTKDSPDAVTVTYTNTKTIQPPNGIITTIAPYAIMVVLAAGAGVYFVYSRRRRNR